MDDGANHTEGGVRPDDRRQRVARAEEVEHDEGGGGGEGVPTMKKMGVGKKCVWQDQEGGEASNPL